VLSTKTTSDKRHYVRLAEYLKAAVLAYLMGITPATAFQKYVKGRKLGWFWFACASYLLDRVRGGPEVARALSESKGVGGSQGVPGVPR